MRKINLFSVLLAMLAIALSVILASCGEEKEPEVDDPYATTSIKISYSVHLADTWYQYFNVEMTSTGPGGEPHTEIIQMDHEISMTLPLNEAPDKVVLTVIAKPKANHPEVVDGTTYSIDYSSNLKVVSLTKDGKESGEIFYSSPFSSTRSTGGDAFRKALKKEHTLCNDSYIIKK